MPAQWRTRRTSTVNHRSRSRPRTAMLRSSSGCSGRVATRARRGGGGNTTLHLAAQIGDLKLVQALLAKGADPNARTPTASAAAARGGGGGRGAVAGEQTPLMAAARADHEDVLRALVAAGADPTMKAQDGSNLVMAAASGARLKAFKYVYEIDPNVDGGTTA